MADPSDSEIALLTEHFGYPPVSLLDDVINSINLLAERALNSVEKGLLQTPPATLGFRDPPSANPSKAGNAQPGPSAEEAHRHEVEAGTHQLETLLCASIDRNFDKFELYVMRNILCVRPEDRDWIRLSHYEGLDLSKYNTGAEKEQERDDDPTVGSVNHLRRRLQASQKLNCMLHAEKARNAALLQELRAIVGVNAEVGNSPKIKNEAQDGQRQRSALEFLHNRGSLNTGDSKTPLTTTTAFTLSQLKALRTLSASLHEIRPEITDGRGSDGNVGEGDASTSWRRERLEYVETATRKHLENVAGLELGKNGEVRDGEWQGEGRNLAKGEAEGLERVVSLLGGVSQHTDEDTEMADG